MSKKQGSSSVDYHKSKPVGKPASSGPKPAKEGSHEDYLEDLKGNPQAQRRRTATGAKKPKKTGNPY